MPKENLAPFLLCACLFFAADGSQDPVSLILAGHYKHARPLLEAKLKQDPKDGNALWQMARVKIAYDDLDGAIRLAEEAVNVDGGNANAHCTLANALGAKAAASSTGNLEKFRLARGAKREGEAGLTIEPRNVDCLAGLIEFYNQAPWIAGGDKRKSEEYLQRLLEADPVRGNLKQADQEQDHKQMDRAEAAYKAALSVNPRSYEANVRIISLYTNDIVRKYDLAEKYAREAIKIDPGRVNGYLVLAQVLPLQNRDSELDPLLAQAEKKVPDDLSPYYQAGRVLLLSNRDYPRAERYFRKYLAQEPEGAAPPLYGAHWRLGQTLEKQGKKPEAIAEIQTALKMKPDLKGAEQDLKRLKG